MIRGHFPPGAISSPPVHDVVSMYADHPPPNLLHAGMPVVQLRVLVKRILRKHGYPPDKAEKATQTVLEQAELLSSGWVA